MKKSILYITLLLITSLCVTACGGSSGGENQPAPSAVSGNAISENKQDKGSIPTKIEIKNPYYDESETTFIIKKQNSQEYQAEINLCVDMEDAGEQSKFNWELYLEMVDEIKQISGATIVSHEGTHYIIRGNTQKYSPDSEWDEDEDEDEDVDEFSASFEITASCQGQIHEPEFCFLSKELYDISEKEFDCRFKSLKKDGDNLNGIIRVSNRSGEKLTGWEIKMDCNFRLTSLDDKYASYGFEYYMDDDEDRLWCQNICGTDKNFELKAGETKEISFTGFCPADKPKLDGDFRLLQQYDVYEEHTWGILENRYGGRYGKMDTYLVADTVWGTDLLFVFDEKKADGYTATAELTNVVAIALSSYEDWDEDEDDDWDEEEKAWKSIADWEIYLECEDTIESITGAEIVSHEGNVYCIRAADPQKWLDPYSFTTFQVKVSCPTGIHPLGKTYLKRAKTRLKYDSDAAEQEQEFSFGEDAFENAAGTKWLSYYQLYDPIFDTDYFEDSSIDEAQNFYKRQAWGKKVGRMPK